LLLTSRTVAAQKNRKRAGCKARHGLKKYKKAINRTTTSSLPLRNNGGTKKRSASPQNVIPKATHGGINKG